jgi:hypothetical protein
LRILRLVGMEKRQAGRISLYERLLVMLAG